MVIDTSLIIMFNNGIKTDNYIMNTSKFFLKENHSSIMSNELFKSIKMDWSKNWNIEKGEILWAFPTYVSFRDSIYDVI